LIIRQLAIWWFIISDSQQAIWSSAI
jgi:hypothetical protein